MHFTTCHPEHLEDLARICASELGNYHYWIQRLDGYLNLEGNTQFARNKRIVYVAVEKGKPVGFIAGHLTSRWECDGELQWFFCHSALNRTFTTEKLFTLMRNWFVNQGVKSVCVNVEPDNYRIRDLYSSFGAKVLNDQWLIWKNIKRRQKHRSA
ncbi:GNAT family N-acetyltransferase [Robertkochia aurantiaca]|uniref:GNAT family N-acetyltransferase n=1 Tax=Robertkochia aurantiaca TaxID=2873700 RepID=UPI001CCA833C|nr:GNAT family N-acetyltransferase [Robertkochia sp. 3YJGBD-33]